VSQALPIVPAALQIKLLEMNAHYRADGVTPVDWAAAYRLCVAMQVWPSVGPRQRREPWQRI
jgi:hypothetical protein